MEQKIKDLALQYTAKEISLIINVPLSSVYYRLKKYNLKPLTKGLELFNSFTSESCYWAGFLAGSGSIFINLNKGTYRISISTSKYPEHLEKFKNALKCKNKIHRKETCYDITVHSKYLAEALVNNFNVTPKKTFLLLPPQNIPNDLIKHYIRGYFESKGYIGYNGGLHCNFDITSGSKDIIEWISSIFVNNNFVEKKYICVKDNRFSMYVGKNTLNLLDWLYSDSENNIRLDSKYEKYCNYKNSIQNVVDKYSDLGVRLPSGCKGFDLDYISIAKEYINGKNLKELAKKYNVSCWTLLDNFKKLNVKKTVKRYQNDNAFSIFTPESCYWAGFLAADGYVSKYRLSIDISNKDYNHLEKFRNFLKSNAKISEHNRVKNNKTYKYNSICVNSKQIVKDLFYNFNIISKKSLVLEPPKIKDVELIKHYIRGYIDGDGSIGWHKYGKVLRLNICSGSYNIIKWIYDNITNIFNVFPSIIKRNNNLYVVEFKGKYVRNILDWLYSSSIKETRLDRKFEVKDRAPKHKTNMKTVEKHNKINRLLCEGLRPTEIQKMLHISKSGYYSVINMDLTNDIS